MAKNTRLDFEVEVDVTEEMGLEANGRFKGNKFLGKVSKKAVELICGEIGKALISAAKTEDAKEVAEEIEEVIENIE